MVLKAEEKSALHNGEQMLAIGTLNENLKNVECCLKRFDNSEVYKRVDKNDNRLSSVC